MQISHRFNRDRLPYLGGVLLVTVLIAVLTGISIWQEAKRYQDRAEIATQNTTHLLAQHIEDTFQKVDGLLQTIIHEYQDHQAHGDLKEARFTAYLDQLSRINRDVEAVRVLDERGMLRYSSGKVDTALDFSDREYFRRLRDLPLGSAAHPMVFSGPLYGRIAQKWGLVLARRHDHADGSFAGVVFAIVDNELFGDLFSSVKLGPKGTIVLRTEDMAQVDRFPRSTNPDQDVGNRKVSQTLLDLVKYWPEGLTYTATTSFDNVTRYYTYRKVGNYPFYVIAGEATQDFLVTQKNNLLLIVGFSALMTVLTWFGFWRIYQLTQKSIRERTDRQASLIMDASPLATLVIQEDGIVLKANLAAHELFGYPVPQLLGRQASELLASQSPAHRQTPSQNFWANRRDVRETTEMLGLRQDGTEFPFQISASSIALDQVNHMIAVFEDLTERKRAEARLHDLLEFQKAILDYSTYGILTTTPQGVVTSFNPAAEQMLGYRSGDVLGKYMPQIFRDQQTELQEPVDGTMSYFDGLIASVRQDGPQMREVICRRKDGSEFTASRSVSILVNERGQVTGILAFLVDITELKQAHDRLAYLAHYDALTNLPNRVLFFERVEQGLALARRNQTHAAMLFLDLDKFKPVNDTWGHAMGDRLLAEVGRRIASCVRESDAVGRIGGDEFVVFLMEVLSLEAAMTVAEKIQFALSRPFHIDDKMLSIGCCMGVALYPEHGATPTELAKSADTAMYSAKATGLEKIAIYTPEMRPA